MTRRPIAGALPRPAAWLAALMRALGSGYRPELHYMRGPGPACRRKAEDAAATAKRPPANAMAATEPDPAGAA